MNLWGLDGQDVKSLMLSVGENHINPRPLTPVEVASRFQLAMNNGANKKDCAQLVHFEGTSMVTRFLALLRLDRRIRHSVQWGSSNDGALGFSSAHELSRLDQEDHETCFRAILENRLTKAEVQQIVELRRKQGKSLEDCFEQVIKQRPEVVRQYVAIGQISNPSVIRQLRARTQQERDELIRRALSRLCPSAGGATGRLGPDSFSLVGDSNLEAYVRADENFEVSLSNEIGASFTNE